MASPGAALLERLPLGRDRPLLAYGGTFAICGFSLAFRLLVAPLLPMGGYPFIAFFPTVMLTTFLFGVRPGIFAGLLSGIVAWYCFLPPVFAVKLSKPVVFAMCFYATVAAVNILLIHTLQQINRRLVAEYERNRQLAERGELLFRELQHRVSNNLQVLSGLLSLQRRDIADDRACFALDEAARRLALIGRIHRQLYSPHGDRLRLPAFLEQLGADLIDASGKPGVELNVEADEDIDFAADAAVPMALIVAEAVTNAIEHGLAARETGMILIRATQAADGAIELRVIDDGAGLPAGFVISSSDSLGLKLAQMLATQLGGGFSLTGEDDGTTAVLRLPQRA